MQIQSLMSILLADETRVLTNVVNNFRGECVDVVTYLHPKLWPPSEFCDEVSQMTDRPFILSSNQLYPLRLV